MKFLLFNLAVAAALGYLFFADRGQIQEAAGGMHDAAQDLRTFAKQAYDRAPLLAQGLKPADKPARAPEIDTANAPNNAPTAPKPAAPAAEPAAKQSAGVTADIPRPPSMRPQTVEPTGTAPVRLTPDSAIVARRREVLEGRPPGDANPALKPGEQLMSPSERRKELVTLAEEMDLFYARSVSR